MATVVGKNSRGGLKKVGKNSGSSGGSDVSGLASQLQGVASAAKSLGIDTRQAEAMVKQTQAQGSTAFKGSSYEKAYLKDIKANPIPVMNLNPQSPAPLPPTPPAVPLPTGTSPTDLATYYGLATDTATDTTGTPVTATTDPFLQAMQMQKDLFEKESPNAGKELSRLERQYDIDQKQRDVNNLKGQLGAITAQAQADRLRLEDQGRGIPEPIILGQQARIDREAAIRALPIAAQLDAAQGDLEMAQQRVDRLFQVRMADAQAQYNFKSKVIDSIANYADKQETKRLEEVRWQQQIKLKKEEQNFSLVSDWAKMAFENGQSTLGGRIMALDTSSPTFQADFARLQSQVVKPVSAPNLDTAFDTDGNLVNMQTGEVIRSATGSVTETTKNLAVVNDINNILNNKSFSNTFGVTSIAYRNIPGTEAYALKQNIANLQSQLSLAARGELKGQGQVSNYEGELLAKAQTALTLNMSPKQADFELRQVKGAIMTSSGLPAQVKITAPDGTSKYGPATQEMISSAVSQGYRVEYQ